MKYTIMHVDDRAQKNMDHNKKILKELLCKIIISNQIKGSDLWQLQVKYNQKGSKTIN